MLPRFMTRFLMRGLLIDDIAVMDLVWIVALLCTQLGSVSAVSMLPKFNNTPEHVTVVEGGRIILPCSVESLGEQSVIWVSPRKTLISLVDRRMIDDHRISVERPYIKIWNLLIRDVRYNDSGVYECRVNTSPIQIKKVTLEVQVPPSILSQLSSDKVVLEEGQSATLVCNVTGIPLPNVTWYRRNYRMPGANKERIGHEGEVLIIHNITRHCDDIYECFVDNGVPPAVSKAIRVEVDYPPEVVLPNPKGIGQLLGKETILDCQIFAHPQAVTSWKKGGKPLAKSDKYDIDVFKNDVEHSVTLALRIRDLTLSDYGEYECFGSNFLGEHTSVMQLYEIKPPPTTTTASTTTTTADSNGHVVIDDRHPKNQKFDPNSPSMQNSRQEYEGRNSGDPENDREGDHHFESQRDSRPNSATSLNSNSGPFNADKGDTWSLANCSRRSLPGWTLACLILLWVLDFRHL